MPPRVFISYSHDSPAHAKRVLSLADRLRSEGVDVHIDQYEMAPPEGWPAWMVSQVREAATVLMICTETYHDRVTGVAPAGEGLGARWEGALITQQLYEAGGRNEKFVPVIFDSRDAVHIPPFVAGTTRYDLSAGDGYERLYRRLTDQPLIERPPLGSLRRLEPRSAPASSVPVASSGEDWVLIWAPDQGIFLIPALRITAGEQLHLQLTPTNSEQTALLRSLADQRRRRLMLAYADTAVVTQVHSVQEHVKSGEHSWTLVLTVDQRDLSGGIFEAGTTGYSADRIAELRARRILLDETDLPERGDHLILESLVSGVSGPIRVERSPLPELYGLQREDPTVFLAAARLVSILWLRLSGTVERILRLDLRLDRTRLDVDFMGRRARKYSNVEPPNIEFRGVLELEASGGEQ